MTYPESNGEKAYKLSEPMIEALKLLQEIGRPHFVPNIGTAVALLNRGMIARISDGQPLHTKTLYALTSHGETALKISA